ncbi:hypothetical protein Tco_0222315 [Tanacetum coccineum]
MLEAKIKSDSFSRINDDAVSLCCVAILQLLLLGLEDRRKVPDWILRLANVRDDWDMYPWARISHHVNQHTQDDVLVDYYRRLEEHDRALKELMQKDVAREQMYNKMNKFMENLMNRERMEARPSIYVQSPYTILPPTTLLPKKRGDKSRNKGTNANVLPFNLGNAIGNDDAVEDDVLIMSACQTDDYIVHEDVDPSKIVKGYSVSELFWRELVPNLYMGGYHELGDSNTEANECLDRATYRERPQGARCICPLMREEITRNKGKNANVLPFNLGNDIGNDNVVEDDVLIMSACQTDDYIMHEDVDPSKIVKGYSILELFWRGLVPNLYMGGYHELGESNTEANECLDRATYRERPQGARCICPLMWEEITSRGCFQGTGRQLYNFQVIYNDGLGCPVYQQANFKHCGVITCWLISKLCASEEPRVNGASQEF